MKLNKFLLLSILFLYAHSLSLSKNKKNLKHNQNELTNQELIDEDNQNEMDVIVLKNFLSLKIIFDFFKNFFFIY